MVELIRRRIDTTTEKKIITGMIASTDFLKAIYAMINVEYFQSEYLRTIAKWVIEYYTVYEKAPFRSIQDIYDKQKQGIEAEESNLIAALLVDVSERFAAEGDVNVSYLTDQALEFFKKRELEITAGNVLFLLERNRIEEAENELATYKKPARMLASWCNPFEEAFVDEYFKEEVEKEFFRMPGQLGRFMGDFEKEWLIALEGPFKIGKTWWLEEIALIAVLKRIPTLLVSLEMNKKKMAGRIFKRITATGDQEGTFLYPVFDCKRNQTDECRRSERTGQGSLIDEESGEKLQYNGDIQWRTCTWCRDNREFRNFVPEVWYQSYNRPSLQYASVARRVKALSKFYRRYFRLLCYPRFSANLEMIERDIDLMEFSESFVPQMIIIDYADILMPEQQSPPHGYEQIDYTWKCLGRLTGKRKATVVTATQVNREGQESGKLRKGHTGGWIGKLGHVDALFTLNQTEAQKGLGAMVVSTMMHRHRPFEEDRGCMVLYNMDVGQIHLDSYGV